MEPKAPKPGQDLLTQENLEQKEDLYTKYRRLISIGLGNRYSTVEGFERYMMSEKIIDDIEKLTDRQDKMIAYRELIKFGREDCWGYAKKIVDAEEDKYKYCTYNFNYEEAGNPYFKPVVQYIFALMEAKKFDEALKLSKEFLVKRFESIGIDYPFVSDLFFRLAKGGCEEAWELAIEAAKHIKMGPVHGRAAKGGSGYRDYSAEQIERINEARNSRVK